MNLVRPVVTGEIGWSAAAMAKQGHVPLVTFWWCRDQLSEAAARISVSVEFLVQWDDERVPRVQSLALFDALASAEKTSHANPDKHGETPAFELESTLRFFARHLG
ncbi:hypothetical protein GCM10010348_71730 [Streptomyces anthocyanicus]|nr:hypothetical protein GCM10010391_45380 [Streptomyces anthocyanicus]GHC34307.1 hypothetical protein GCM10010348_71730 [Streptomyces anthocyanicus]